MALSVNEWRKLTRYQKDEVINFLRGNCKIDLEHPARSAGSSSEGYPISEGYTIGGHPMKYGQEYRIYVCNIRGIPVFLDSELKERGTKNRIGGSEAIKEIMLYGDLQIGHN